MKESPLIHNLRHLLKHAKKDLEETLAWAKELDAKNKALRAERDELRRRLNEMTERHTL